MSTRGTAYFEIQETIDSKRELIATASIYSDAYPSGFGCDICEQLNEYFISKTKELIASSESKVFRNTERVILELVSDYGSGYYDDEYIYRFVFKEFLALEESYPVRNIVEVEVTYLDSQENCFKGTFQEFESFCKSD